MANMIAIISKKIFETFSTPPPQLGTVVPLDGYDSKTKALNNLGSDDRLFLVTVRPPDEQLWLVAILEGLSFTGQRWQAQTKNTTPVTDITHLRSELKFTSGKGISMEPGKLGMSLQSPRELARRDCELLDEAVGRIKPRQGERESPVNIKLQTQTQTQTQNQNKKQIPAQIPKQPYIQKLGVGPWPELSSIEGWAALERSERLGVAQRIAEALGDDFHAGDLVGEHELPTFVHKPTALEFVAVPGGAFIMGFTLDDITTFWSSLKNSDLNDPRNWRELRSDILRSRPPVPVRVRPFLCARYLLKKEGDNDEPIEYYPDDEEMRFGPEEGPALARSLGFRLLSSVEWEWVAREGGRVQWTGVPLSHHPLTPKNAWKIPLGKMNGMGVYQLHTHGEYVADGWHEDYRGAPATSDPWDPGATAAMVRMGHVTWQDETERIALQPAFREWVSKDGAGMRAALDLPRAEMPGMTPPGLGSTITQTIAALRGDDDHLRRAALVTLNYLYDHEIWYEDAPVAVEALLGLLRDHPALKDRHRILKCIAEVLTADHTRLVTIDPVLEQPNELQMSVRRAVLSGLDIYRQFLHDPDERVRATAALILAFCPEGCPALFDEVHAIIGTEKKPAVKASHIMCLGYLARAIEDDQKLVVLDKLLKQRTGLLKSAAGIAWVIAHGAQEDVPELVVDNLLAGLELKSQPADKLPWHDGLLSPWSLEVLRCIPDNAQRAAMALVEAARKEGFTTDEGATHVMNAVKIMFPLLNEGRIVYDQLMDPNDLTTAQQCLVESLSEESVRLFRGSFWQYGIPDLLEDRRKWLGLDPPGILEREVELEGFAKQPLWRMIRQCWNRGIEGEELLERLGAVFTPLERLEICLEGIEGRYQLGTQSNYRTAKSYHCGGFQNSIQSALKTALDASREETMAWVEQFAEERLALMERGVVSWGGNSILLAMARSMPPGEMIKQRYEPLLKLTFFSAEVLTTILSKFPNERCEEMLMNHVREREESALTKNRWDVSLQSFVRSFAPLLEVCPSKALAWSLLRMGALAGQPADARENVDAFGHLPGVAEALEEYDGRVKNHPIQTYSDARALYN